MNIRWSTEWNNEFFPRSTDQERQIAAKKFLFNMERSIFLGIVVLIVLTAFIQGSPINEENDANVMRKNSLLEKLGMELQRWGKRL